MKFTVLLCAALFTGQLLAQEADLLDRTRVIINSSSLTEVELLQEARMLSLQLQAQAPGKNFMRDHNFLRQVLENMIREEVLKQEAERIGLTVSDTQINENVQSMAAGNNMDLFAFRRALQSEGIDFLQFREGLRKRLLIEQLQTRQNRDINPVSEQEIDDFLSRNPGSIEWEYRLRHILFPIPDAATPEQVRSTQSLAETVLQRLAEGESFALLAREYSRGQQSLNGGDLGWLKAAEVPSLFSDAVTQMEKGQVLGPLRSPSGLHLLLFEDSRAQDRIISRQTKARHILIRTSEVVSDEDAVAKLNELKQRLESGSEFKALAEAHSEDTVSAARGGELGWLKPGQTVDAFEQKMRELAPMELSAPFKSQFGWHIVQVLERRQVDETEENRRNRIREALFKGKRQEYLQQWQQRLRDEAYIEYLDPE